MCGPNTGFLEWTRVTTLYGLGFRVTIYSYKVWSRPTNGLGCLDSGSNHGQVKNFIGLKRIVISKSLTRPLMSRVNPNDPFFSHIKKKKKKKLKVKIE